MKHIDYLLNKNHLSKEDLCFLIESDDEDILQKLFRKSRDIKEKYVGKTVYFRGLIEFSNQCVKNCLYCGIRKDNKSTERYNLTDKEIIQAAKFAYTNKYGSVVLQSGEKYTQNFADRIDRLIKEIKKTSKQNLGITLSLGEQTESTYQKWFNSGAHRYLLRIESSNQELYEKIHPMDDQHSYINRIDALKRIKKCGYQTGTGVMIGLPFQKISDLASDLLFMQEFDIDMCGMGPYIEHVNTPLNKYSHQLYSLEKRFELSLRMIALLRIMMKDINIAAATALQAIDKAGREKALQIGANVIMPNITPGSYRERYQLYNNKPCMDEEAADCVNCLEGRIHIAGLEIGYNQWGDAPHFRSRSLSQNSIKH